MAPKLYVFPASPASRSVLVTAKSIGLTLDIKELDYTKNEHKSPEYLKLNPQHTAPTLDDNGKVICDSHAIIAYLASKYGKDDWLYPKDLYKRALVDQRLAFDLGTLFPILKTVSLAYFKGETKSQNMIDEIQEAYGFFEKFLEGKQWIAIDHVTIADFSCYTTITCLDVHLEVDPKTYPNTAAWLKRVQALPCFASDEERLNVFKGFYGGSKS